MWKQNRKMLNNNYVHNWNILVTIMHCLALSSILNEAKKEWLSLVFEWNLDQHVIL